jgi:hypothetical protein
MRFRVLNEILTIIRKQSAILVLIALPDLCDVSRSLYVMAYCLCYDTGY